MCSLELTRSAYDCVPVMNSTVLRLDDLVIQLIQNCLIYKCSQKYVWICYETV
jgi:hypothetical protein